MKYLIILIFLNNLYSFNIEAVDDSIEKVVLKDSNGNILAEDGKPIIEAINIPVIKPINIPVIKPMNIPVIYTKDQIRKRKYEEKLQKEKEKQLAKKKKKVKKEHFVKKESLIKEKLKAQKIVIEDGAEFFNTINKEDIKPVDIEK